MARDTRDLKGHPQKEDLAIRLVHGRGRKVVEGVLRQFGQEAAERPDDRIAQLAYAQVLLAAERWGEAEQHFDLAAQIDPSDFASRWGKARALMGMGARRAAIVVLRAALGVAREPHDIARVGRELTRAALAEGDVDAELDGRQALIGLHPAPGPIFALALTLNKAGRSRAAGELLAAHVDAIGRSERARWMLAEGQYRAGAGDLASAAAALERARRLAIRRQLDLRREIWSSLIDISRRQGTLDRLKGELTTPKDSVEWEARARLADEAGDLADARTAIDEAVRHSPQDVELRMKQIAVARRMAAGRDIAELYTDLATVAARPGHENPPVVAEALDGLWQQGAGSRAALTLDKLLADGRRGVPMLRVMAETATQWGDDRRAERCWAAVLKRIPGDEGAVVAIGELQLQRGQRRMAVQTWRTLVRGSGRARADSHARVAEILSDHDFHDPALEEARAAVGLYSGETRYHRLLATILERQGRTSDAEREWELLLRTASGAQRASERKEARARLVSLWSRAGTARVETKLREMEEALRRDGRDRETLTFLVEAEIRTGREAAAIAQLIARLSDDASSERADADADADLILLLVRTLRQAHRSDQAMDWLEQLIRRYPGRAREARLQLADIALSAHDDRRAQEFANLAATSDPSDPRVVLRAATVQERLGHFAEAETMYRRIVAVEHGDAAAALALASLLSRQGDHVQEQRALLRDVLCHATDQEMITLAGVRAIVLEEAGGTLEDLETLLADTPDLNSSSPEAAARRRVLAAVLWRLVPPAYRQQWQDANARAKIRNFARQGMRPLLDLVNAPETEPDPHAVEVLGMLGRSEAVSALSRLLILDVDVGTSTTMARTRPPLSDEVVSLTVIALGRVGGDVARGALESFAQHLRPACRLALLWALGRAGGSRALQMAKQEISRKVPQSAILGCLTLGRLGGADAESVLLAVAEEPTEPPQVRVAAILGLGLGSHTNATASLSQFLDSADRTIARAARTALGWSGRWPADGTPGMGLPSGSAAAGAAATDEAVAIVGGRVDAEALIQALLARPTVAGLAPDEQPEPGPHPRDGGALRALP